MPNRHVDMERSSKSPNRNGELGAGQIKTTLKKGKLQKKGKTTPTLAMCYIFLKRDDRLLCIYSSTLLSHSLPAPNYIILTYNI